MTESTRVVTISIEYPLRLLIPVVLTYILARKYKVSYANNRLYGVLAVSAVWIILYWIKEQLIFNVGITLFFLPIMILIAYTQIKAFGESLFPLFEYVLATLACVSFVLYSVKLFSPGLAEGLFSLFPETHNGHNVLYLFHYGLETGNEDYYGSLVRNSGLSWEPGRYAIMLLMGICSNLYRNGIVFRGNKTLIIFVAAMISTLSTTGIPLMLLAFALFYVREFSAKYIIVLVLFFIPVAYMLLGLQFVEGKIESQMEVINNLDYYSGPLTYTDAAENEYIYSVDRLPSILLEYQNFINDPILGYGFWNKSNFYESISTNVTLTGGLVKVFAQYGLFYGFFIYILLFLSSRQLSIEYGHKNKWILFILTLGMSVSYPIFNIMLFMTFWLYGSFSCARKD